MHDEQNLPNWLVHNLHVKDLINREEHQLHKVTEQLHFRVALIFARLYQDIEPELTNNPSDSQKTEIIRILNILRNAGQLLLAQIECMYKALRTSSWSGGTRKYRELDIYQRRQLLLGEDAGYQLTVAVPLVKKGSVPDTISVTLYGGEINYEVLKQIQTTTRSLAMGNGQTEQIEKILSQNHNLLICLQREGKTLLDLHITLSTDKSRHKRIIIERLAVEVFGSIQQLAEELPYPSGNDEEVLHDGIIVLYKDLQKLLQSLEK